MGIGSGNKSSIKMGFLIFDSLFLDRVLKSVDQKNAAFQLFFKIRGSDWLTDRNLTSSSSFKNVLIDLFQARLRCSTKEFKRRF